MKPLDWEKLNDSGNKMIGLFGGIIANIDEIFPGKRDHVVDILIEIFLSCRIIDQNDKWDAECYKIKVNGYINEMIKDVFNDKT